MYVKILDTGTVGEVTGYVAVLHVIMAVVKVDNRLEAIDIKRLTPIEREKPSEHTRPMGSGRPSAGDHDPRRDGSNDSLSKGIKGS